MPTDAWDRFLRFLKNDILKLNLADLDFGVYRILAHRRQEIECFFDEKLPARIEAVREARCSLERPSTSSTCRIVPMYTTSERIRRASF